MGALPGAGGEGRWTVELQVANNGGKLTWQVATSTNTTNALEGAIVYPQTLSTHTHVPTSENIYLKTKRMPAIGYRQCY